MDTETLMIFSVGVLDSEDSVPYNKIIDTLEECDSLPELRAAVQELLLISSGMAITLAGLLSEGYEDDPITPMEVVERNYAIALASEELD